jgi:lisH domain-containing protein FOPNL
MMEEEISLENDLKLAIKEALDRKGVMKDMRARLRASVFHCLEDKSVPLPTKKSKDLYLSTELVREFLISLNLENTLSVFCEELGQESEMNCDKEFVAGELGFNVRPRNGEENIDSIPLLTLLVQQARLNKDNYEPDSSLITQKGT